MRHSARLAALFSMTLLGACGSDNAGGTGGLPGGAGTTGPVSVEDFPKRYVDAYCKVVASCCGAASVSYDDAYCREKNAFNPDKYARLVSGETSRFDADAAGACLDAVAGAGCDVGDDLFDHPGCAGVIVGVVALDGVCHESFECAPIAGKQVGCGGIRTEDGPGKCAVRVSAALGEACGDSIYGDCAPGLACSDPSGATGTCITAPAAGQPCAYRNRCQVDAVCALEGAASTCRKIAADGESCASFVDCAKASFCRDGSCEQRRAEGAACVLREECATNYCYAGACRARAIGSCELDDGVDGGPL